MANIDAVDGHHGALDEGVADAAAGEAADGGEAGFAEGGGAMEDKSVPAPLL